MSATIQARGVGAAFGDRELFSGLDLVIAPGDVVGLVGPNGAGKSTILRMLAGVRAPDAGTITVSPRDAHLGFLTQQPDARPGESIRDQILRRPGVAANDSVLHPEHPGLAARPQPEPAPRGDGGLRCD